MSHYESEIDCRCPRCNGYASSHVRWLYLVGMILLFPFGLLLLVAPRPAQCWQCGHKFEVEGMRAW